MRLGRTNAVPGPSHQELIDTAFDRSRKSLPPVLLRLRALDEAIKSADGADGTDKILALQRVGRFDRDIAVISRRLFVSSDPLSTEFRDTLKKVIDLIHGNATASSAIIDQGDLGRCAAGNYTPPGVPFAATTQSDPDPRVSVCTPFFDTNDDLRRDIITHEFFHLVGLADVSVTNASEGLNNAHTMAQIVSFLHDRARQANAIGGEQQVPPLPMP